MAGAASRPAQDAKVVSTHYAKNWPLFNAKLPGTVGDAEFLLCIAVNWYAAEGTEPLFRLWAEGDDTVSDALGRHTPLASTGVVVEGPRLQVEPDLDGLDFEADFGRLLDEAVRCFDALAQQQAKAAEPGEVRD